MSSPVVDEDPYAALGVSPDVPQAQVTRAYRRLAVTWHPDRHAQSSEEAKEVASKHFATITRAYAIVGTTEERKKWDRHVEKKGRRSPGRGTPPPKRSRRDDDDDDPVRSSAQVAEEMLFAAGGGCDAAQVRLFAAGAGSLPLLWRLEKASGTKGPLGQRKPGSLILHRSPSLTLPGRKETLSGSRYCEIREADSECPFRQGQRVWLGRLTAPEDQGGGARGDVPKAWNTGGAAGVWVNGGAALPVRVVQQKAAGDDEEHWLLEAYHWTGGASGTTYTFVEDTGPEEQTAAAADGAAAEPESDDDAW